MKEMNNEMELNMDELEHVNGGWRFCLGFGASNGPSAGACCMIGKSTDANKDSFGAGANACIYFGLGFGFDCEDKTINEMYR